MLDLGAGAGALTAPLVTAGAHVVAVERNSALAGRLRRRFSGASVTVLEDDVLDVPLPRRAYRVVASIPFSITTPLLGRLLDPPATCLDRAALIVEWGAGRRFCTVRPADPRILWWSARYELRIAGRIGAQSFSPAPRVNAAVLVAALRGSPLVPRDEQAPFARLLAVAFETRRAPVAEALTPVFSRRQARRLVRDLGVDPQLPISLLRIDQWAAINTAMVTLIPARHWPHRTPGFWATRSHASRDLKS